MGSGDRSTLKRRLPIVPRVAACVLLLTGVLIAAGSTAPWSEIALVTDLRGDVTLQRAGERQTQPLSQTTFLGAGDLLRTGAEGRATLFQLHAPVVILAPTRTLTVAPLPASPQPESLPADLFALLVKQLGTAARSAKARSPLQRPGAGERVVTALTPRHSRVLETRPTFVWTRMPDARRYKITVYDRSDQILWETTTRETHASYPAACKPLAAGAYAWEVLALGERRKGLDTAPFTVATEREATVAHRALARAARLVTGNEVTPLPYLAVCLEYHLYPRAEAVLKQVAARTPNDPVLAELAMRLYQLTHRWDEREQARPIRVGAQ